MGLFHCIIILCLAEMLDLLISNSGRIPLLHRQEAWAIRLPCLVKGSVTDTENACGEHKPHAADTIHIQRHCNGDCEQEISCLFQNFLVKIRISFFYRENHYENWNLCEVYTAFYIKALVFYPCNFSKIVFLPIYPNILTNRIPIKAPQLSISTSRAEHPRPRTNA